MTSKTCPEHVDCFPCPFNIHTHTYSYIFSPFHWLFNFFSSRQLKRYLKLLLVYLFISISRLQFVSVAVKHDSSLGSSQSGLTTSVWANNEITKLIHMQKKASKKHQRTKAGSGAVRHWLQEGGGCSAASAQHVHAARRAVSALRQTWLLLAKYFQILTSSEAASALAVAVSAKPLQHQASCFRLSKLLWLVLTLFRLLTLKLHYLLSQFLYIAGRGRLFAKIGTGWGGLKRQGKDFGFLVATWNLPMGWI